MTSNAEGDASHPSDPYEIDPIWTSSRTARQIYALGEVEKVRVLASYNFHFTNQTIGYLSPALFGSLIYFPPDLTADGCTR
jgi:hypothetical protein